MTIVFSKVENPSGQPLFNIPVYATLIGRNLSAFALTQRQTSTRTDAAGNWSLDLRPNSRYSTETYYEIVVGNKDRFKVIVPDGIPAPGIKLSDLVANYVVTTSVSLIDSVQNLSEGQKEVMRSNLSLGDAAEADVDDFAIRANSICVVVGDNSGYSAPSLGYGAYHYFGLLDPSLDPTLPKPIGSEWIPISVQTP